MEKFFRIISRAYFFLLLYEYVTLSGCPLNFQVIVYIAENPTLAGGEPLFFSNNFDRSSLSALGFSLYLSPCLFSLCY